MGMYGRRTAQRRPLRQLADRVAGRELGSGQRDLVCHGRVAAGHPAQQILGISATPQRLDLLREQLNLDDSIPERYGRLLWSTLQGLSAHFTIERGRGNRTIHAAREVSLDLSAGETLSERPIRQRQVDDRPRAGRPARARSRGASVRRTPAPAGAAAAEFVRNPQATESRELLDAVASLSRTLADRQLAENGYRVIAAS